MSCMWVVPMYINILWEFCKAIMILLFLISVVYLLSTVALDKFTNEAPEINSVGISTYIPKSQYIIHETTIEEYMEKHGNCDCSRLCK